MAKVLKGSAADYKPTERKEIMLRFLKSYAKHGIFSRAADRSGVNLHTIRSWQKKYPKFAGRIEEMQDRFVDGLEMIAIERAKEKSDSLMALMLKANRPEKYKENVKLDADVKNQHAPIQLVFSQEEWGAMPNYVNGGGDTDGENTEHSSDPGETES